MKERFQESKKPQDEAFNSHLLLTVNEVALLLRLTPKGIYSLIENRRIPFIKISNRVRFLQADVISWLQKNRVPALEETRQ